MLILRIQMIETIGYMHGDASITRVATKWLQLAAQIEPITIVEWIYSEKKTVKG